MVAALALLATVAGDADRPAERWRRPRVRTLTVTATSYCPCPICTGPSSPARGGHGLTASGRRPLAGMTIATDPRIIPMGSYVNVQGLGLRFAADTGSAIKGAAIDVYVDTHEEARRFGRRRLRVRVLEDPPGVFTPDLDAMTLVD